MNSVIQKRLQREEGIQIEEKEKVKHFCNFCKLKTREENWNICGLICYTKYLPRNLILNEVKGIAKENDQEGALPGCDRITCNGVMGIL
jgi:hypothetical protein